MLWWNSTGPFSICICKLFWQNRPKFKMIMEPRIQTTQIWSGWIFFLCNETQLDRDLQTFSLIPTRPNPKCNQPKQTKIETEHRQWQPHDAIPINRQPQPTRAAINVIFPALHSSHIVMSYVKKHFFFSPAMIITMCDHSWQQASLNALAYLDSKTPRRTEIHPTRVRVLQYQDLVPIKAHTCDLFMYFIW